LEIREGDKVSIKLRPMKYQVVPEDFSPKKNSKG
jgi:hypothetical protein